MVITKKWALAMLKAVDATIHKYKNTTDAVCRLCTTARDFTPNKTDRACSVCPWMVFGGRDCQDIDDTSPTWGNWYFQGLTTKQCLSRLYGWRKRLKNILAKPRKKIGRRAA